MAEVRQRAIDCTKDQYPKTANAQPTLACNHRTEVAAVTTAAPASLSRRSWLRSLATIAVAALTVRTGHSKSSPQPAEVELLDCAVAGFQFHHGEQLWTQLGVGERVQLQREPDNPHDALAIAVHYRGQQIGYIPRLANRALARRLDEGLPTVATISTLHQRSDPWQRVSIRVVGLVQS